MKEENEEKMEITTVHEAIYDYNIANNEYKEKIIELKKYHKTDVDVLKAIIKANFNLHDNTPIGISGETIEIQFPSKIEYRIFEALENTGLKYEVVSVLGENKMWLRIYLE